MNFRLIKINTLVYGLLFVLLASFLVHNFDSIGQDIGRHLKVGEIIWETKEVPRTNLFSFTEPDFPFINHHWLSEVLLFGIFSVTGFTGLILVKTILVLVAFLLLFSICLLRSDLEIGKGRTLSVAFWPVVISFLLSMFIFIQRTEVRPEIFSFIILSFFLFALFKAKYPPRSDRVPKEWDSHSENLKNPQGRTFNYLWFLPVLELFWVNFHIYFFIGPFLVLAFLVDRLITSRFDLFKDSRSNLGIKKIIIILFLTLAATLVNPNGIQGALLPFNVLNQYGYSIVENQTLSFLADFMSFNLSVFAFKLSMAVLAFSLILSAKKSRQRIFEIIVLTFFVYAGFRMLRNLPLYALASFPVLAMLLTDVFNWLERKYQGSTLGQVLRSNLGALTFKILTAVFLVFMIFSVANSGYYKYAEVSRISGFSVPNGLKRAVDFVKQNKIEGPMFNNFDIGGYLIWQLYPQERVFVDNRPEAYSVKFFNEIYKPMQEDEKKWLEFSEKYGINFIFFAHTDVTPWGDSFLRHIVKDPAWKIVYINEDVIVLVKNNNKNAGVVSKLSITDKNAINKITDYVKSSNKNKADLNLVLSRVLYKIDWLEPSAYFADEVIKIDPQNPYAYLSKGLVHIYYTDKQNQQLAEENIKKAIDLGLKEGQYYFILGVVYMNLGRFESAEESLKEAVRLDKNNAQAKEFLNKYFGKSR